MYTDDTELSGSLRRLPALEPPTHGWEAVQQALQRHASHGPAGSAALWRVAAVVLLMLTLLVLVVAQPWSANRQMVPLLAGDARVEELMIRSQQLEAVLRELPRRPAVEQAGTAVAIEELQSRIQQLDTQLSVPEVAGSHEVQQLWDQRVQLMSSLVGVRFAEATRHDRWISGNGEFL